MMIEKTAIPIPSENLPIMPVMSVWKVESEKLQKRFLRQSKQYLRRMRMKHKFNFIHGYFTTRVTFKKVKFIKERIIYGRLSPNNKDQRYIT